MMRDRWVLAALLPAMLAAILAAGCGRGGPERIVVHGTVTYRGEAIKTGQMLFVPVKGTKAPSSGCYIRNGEYRTDAKGGVPVGRHHVRIMGYLENPPGAAVSLIPKQYLPAKYNTKTELEITVEPGSDEVNRDFSLD